jgi:hypothetical protein
MERGKEQIERDGEEVQKKTTEATKDMTWEGCLWSGVLENNRYKKVSACTCPCISYSRPSLLS